LSANENDYNGWTNWETWNLKLWLDNDEGTYREVQRIVNRAYSVDKLEDELKGYVLDIMPDGTPDMDGTKDLFKVNFTEIAESLWSEKESNDD